jgi:hypothetical protein
VVGITPSTGSNGYWLVATDGGVFTYGPGAAFYGSTANLQPPPKVVGLAARAGGAPGYVIVADGGHPYEFGP